MNAAELSGTLVLVIGPSGSGKGSIMQHVHDTFPNLVYPVSCTSRSMRPGEIDGVNYHYISREAFEEKVRNNEFLEWTEYGGNLYGTLTKSVTGPMQSGKVVVHEIEIQGALAFLEKLPREKLVIVFIDAGDWNVLQKRILKRCEMNETELALRKERYEEEVKFSDQYADVVIENKDGKLEEARKTMEEVIRGLLKQ